MEWVKLIATPPYYIDPALLRAGEAAEVLFCRGLAYCGTVESKGVIDKTVLPMLCPKPNPRAAALVREGLWLDEGDAYRIRSWDKWQDEHDQAAERKRRDRDRKREARRTPSGQSADVSADSPPDVSAEPAESPALDREEDGDKEKDTGDKPPDLPRQDVEAVCVGMSNALLANDVRHSITAKWRTEARLLLDRDKRPLDEVLVVIAWATSDRFWRKNIHSVPTLREKYDKLRMQALDSGSLRPTGTDPHDEWGFD